MGIPENLRVRLHDVLGVMESRRDRTLAGDPARYVFWPDSPDGGLGVTYVDPKRFGLESEYNRAQEWIPRQRELWQKLLRDIPRVISISMESRDDLGRRLAALAVSAFDGFEGRWIKVFDKRGAALDDALICWIKKHVGSSVHEWETDDGHGNFTSWSDTSYHNVVDDFMYNDYTNRAFNYAFIKKLASDGELANEVLEADYFDDGVRVPFKYGYYSSAYATALFVSLKRHSLLEPAILSYESFIHYHPYDSIVDFCAKRAAEKFANAYVERFADPVREVEQENINSCSECEDSTDDYGPVHYVDGTPIYDAGSQEEAEIIYWNTH